MPLCSKKTKTAISTRSRRNYSLTGHICCTRVPVTALIRRNAAAHNRDPRSEHGSCTADIQVGEFAIPYDCKPPIVKVPLLHQLLFERRGYHPPRPFRSQEEQLMVRRLALWWWTCRDPSRPSARAWAKQLGITHVWLLKLVREFETDPGEVRRLQAYGYPTCEQLDRAKESTQRMRNRGELRSPSRRVPPAMKQFVRERFAQGWSKSRLARELCLERKTVKRILQTAA